MTKAVIALLVLLAAASAGLSVAAGQAVPARPPAPARPVNLQVLPASLAPQELDALMKRYARDLGVRCSYCHVEMPGTGQFDYASDDAPAKQVARVMIAMLDDINNRHLAQLADTSYGEPVSCGTCHRGRISPASFNPS